MLLRRLLDGERIAEHAGRFYTMRDALVRAAADPGPPADPDRRLRAAEDAPDDRPLRRRLERRRVRSRTLAAQGRDPPRALRRGRPEPGRDRADGRRVWMSIRDDPAEARRVLAANAAANGDTLADDDDGLRRLAQKIADELRPIVELGFRHILVDAMAPYDAETIERLPRGPRAAGRMSERCGSAPSSGRSTRSWPEFRDAALAAEAAGWDSVWTWDHLLAIFGPWEQPIFEGWTLLAGRRRRSRRKRPARADGRREHVPQPGPDREARDDARPRRRTAGPSSGSAAPGSSASTRRSGST